MELLPPGRQLTTLQPAWSESDRRRTITEQRKGRPVARWAIAPLLQIIEFCMLECGRFILSLCQMSVKVLHQGVRGGIVHIPQRPDHAFRAGEQERFRESVNALLTFELSSRRITSRERH